MMDLSEKEELYAEESLQRAYRMVQAIGEDTNPREIFFATAMVMAWTLQPQSQDIRASAIDAAVDILKHADDFFRTPKLNS
jgi:hypothetical protein